MKSQLLKNDIWQGHPEVIKKSNLWRKWGSSNWELNFCAVKCFRILPDLFFCVIHAFDKFLDRLSTAPVWFFRLMLIVGLQTILITVLICCKPPYSLQINHTHFFENVALRTKTHIDGNTQYIFSANQTQLSKLQNWKSLHNWITSDYMKNVLYR